MSNYEFQEGDKVDWCGLKGVVEFIDEKSPYSV